MQLVYFSTQSHRSIATDRPHALNVVFVPFKPLRVLPESLIAFAVSP